jgi:hypothetical protein
MRIFSHSGFGCLGLLLITFNSRDTFITPFDTIHPETQRIDGVKSENNCNTAGSSGQWREAGVPVSGQMLDVRC